MITAMRLVGKVEGDTSGLVRTRDESRRLFREIDQAAETTSNSVKSKLSGAWDAGTRAAQNAGTIFYSTFNGIRGSLNSLASEAGATGAAMSAMFTLPIAGAAKMGLSFNDLERRTVKAFTTMLGSEQKAVDMFQKIQRFAADSPFDAAGIISYAQRLLGAKIAADQLLPSIKAIGDFITLKGGNTQTIERVTLALTQMTSKGKVQLEELNQIAEALPGANAVEMLAKQAGVTTAKMQEMISKGIVPADWAVKTLIYRMGKEAPDAMKKGQDTIQAQVAALKDNATQLFGTFTNLPGFSLFDGLVKGLTGLNEKLVEGAKTVKNWSTETKTNVFAALAGFASMGPALVVISTLGKVLGMVMTPMGLFGVGVGLVTNYLVKNKQEAMELQDLIRTSFADAFGGGAAAAQQLENAGRALTDVLKTLIPFVAQIAKVASDAIVAFQNLDPAIQTVVASIAGGLIIWGKWGGAISTVIGFVGTLSKGLWALAGGINAVLLPALTAAIGKMGIASKFSLATGGGTVLNGASGAATTAVGVIGAGALGYGIGTAIDQLLSNSIGFDKFMGQAEKTDEATKQAMSARTALMEYVKARKALEAFKKDFTASGGRIDAAEAARLKGFEAQVEKLRLLAQRESDIIKGRIKVGQEMAKQGAAGANGGAGKGDGIAGPQAPGAFKPLGGDKDGERAAKALEKLYMTRIRGIQETIAMDRKELEGANAVTEVVKVRYEIEHGALAKLSADKKAQLLYWANEKDAIEKTLKSVQAYRDLRGGIESNLRGLRAQVALGPQATESERAGQAILNQIAEFEAKNGKMSTQRRAELEDYRQQIIALTQKMSLQKAIAAISEIGANADLSQREQGFRQLVGADAVKELQKAGTYAQEYQRYLGNLDKSVLASLGRQTNDLTQATQYYGQEGYKAAVQAAGGWEALNDATKDAIEKMAQAIDFNRGMTSGLQLRTQIQNSLNDATKLFTTEAERADLQFQTLMDPKKVTLTDSQRAALENLRKEVVGLAGDLDRAALSKQMADGIRASANETANLRDQMSGLYTEGQLQVRAWERTNEEMLRKIAEIQGQDAADRYRSEMEYQILKRQGYEEEEKRRQYARGIANDLAGIVVSGIQDMFKVDDGTVERFRSIQDEIRQIKIDLAKDPGNEGLMTQLKEMQDESSKLARKIHGDLGGAFDRLFGRIYAGFRDLLVKMAMEYLQSQLAKLLLRTVGNALGGGSGGNFLSVLAGSNVRGYAVGTNYLPAGRAALVGDDGPEIIQSEDPLSITRSGRRPSSGGNGDVYNVTLVLPGVTDGKEFERSALSTAKKAFEVARRASSRG